MVGGCQAVRLRVTIRTLSRMWWNTRLRNKLQNLFWAVKFSFAPVFHDTDHYFCVDHWPALTNGALGAQLVQTGYYIITIQQAGPSFHFIENRFWCDKIQAHVDPQLEYDLYGAAVGVTLWYGAPTIQPLIGQINEWRLLIGWFTLTTTEPDPMWRACQQ